MFVNPQTGQVARGLLLLKINQINTTSIAFNLVRNVNRFLENLAYHQALMVKALVALM
ncbi:hypothetical protein ACFQ3N_13110 [Virgibacillus byunsanensis]|uniref:Uncharacterized protein n=1 Tax=Virgibacillus byunsanensis TaxID=570945 RepID=A0ABW3LR46_9BACI